jgi:hypothetical protein
MRERGRKGREKAGRERRRQEGREGGKKGGRQGGRKGGRQGGREEGRKKKKSFPSPFRRWPRPLPLLPDIPKCSGGFRGSGWQDWGLWPNTLEPDFVNPCARKPLETQPLSSPHRGVALKQKWSVCSGPLTNHYFGTRQLWGGRYSCTSHCNLHALLNLHASTPPPVLVLRGRIILLLLRSLCLLRRRCLPLVLVLRGGLSLLLPRSLSLVRRRCLFLVLLPGLVRPRCLRLLRRRHRRHRARHRARLRVALA